MGWTETPIRECRACNGQGGWSHRHPKTGEQIYDRCTRCDGHGSLQWGADTEPDDSGEPDNWKDLL